MNDTVRMSRLRQNERNRAFGMFAVGTSVTRVVRVFGCCRETFHNLVRHDNQIGLETLTRAVDVGFAQLIFKKL